ncbi:MAG: DinB family protein [Actinomycetota bacterium]|nr:DinB family protein [Actinomycetota bacterium]
MADAPTTAHPRITTCDPVAGYPPQIGRYVAQLHEVRRFLEGEVAGLTVAQIDWHPDAQTESIGTLLLHLDAVEWSWMHEDLLGVPSAAYPGDWAEAMPIRQGVPQVSGRPVDRYLQQLAATRAQTLQILCDFTDADLVRLVGEAEVPPGVEARSELYTVDWILWHVIEHEAMHVGQIELLRRLGPARSDQAAQG